MAKSWCGFMPQNQVVKEEWELLEASQEQVNRWLRLAADETIDEAPAMAEKGPVLTRKRRGQ